jgi:hypothetical protein
MPPSRPSLPTATRRAGAGRDRPRLGPGLALARAPQRRVAPQPRAASRAVAACLGLAGASPSRLRLSAHGFDISY